MPQVINTVTKAAPTDNYPVVKDTDLSGSYRIVANITERDAIVSNQRKQSMLVFVISDLHFYSLQADLLTWTDLGTSLGGGSYAPPIARYVYLVQDASDAARMGGSTNNTYTSFQNAYNAANALQVALGGANIVAIMVGSTTAATVGNLTLTANYNFRVQIIGISKISSIVGNIIGDNVAGNGFGVGTTFQRAVFSNVQIGNISTSATGAVGNSGAVGLSLNFANVGSITTSTTNIANVVGSGGGVNIANVNTQSASVVGAISTSAQSTTANAGAVSIAGNNTLNLGGVTTANNNNSGAITITGVDRITGNITCNLATTGGASNIFLLNIFQGGTVVLSSVDASVISMTNCNFSGGFIFNNVGAGVIRTAITLDRVNFTFDFTGQNTGVTPYAFNLIIKNCQFRDIVLPSNTTEIYNSIINGHIRGVEASVLNPTFVGIIIKGTQILGVGKTYAIDQTGYGGIQIRTDNNNIFAKPLLYCINYIDTLVDTSGYIGLLPGDPNFTWDWSQYRTARIECRRDTNYTLSLANINFVFGKKYYLWVRWFAGSGSGGTFGFGQPYKIPGGIDYGPSPLAVETIDLLEIMWIGDFLMINPIKSYTQP